MSIIKFTDTVGVFEEYCPKPAEKFIPDWYKNTESYIGNEKKPTGDGNTTATIKRCMPVFDSICQGYIITTYTDIFVSQKENAPWYEWPSMAPIQFHPIEQAQLHPVQNGAPYPKLMNPWAIKTPPGYSTLFMAPVHRSNIFTILPGVVDTDKYTASVNFPMTLTDIKFEGLVPAGTPIVQVIPFKRDSWSMELGNKKEIIEQDKIIYKLRTRFFDSYKTQYRQTKEYK